MEHEMVIKSGDVVEMKRLIPPEDLAIGSRGIIVSWDDVCVDMLLVKWDIGWTGLYRPSSILKVVVGE